MERNCPDCARYEKAYTENESDLYEAVRENEALKTTLTRYQTLVVNLRSTFEVSAKGYGLKASRCWKLLEDVEKVIHPADSSG